MQVRQRWDHSQAGCNFSSPPLALLHTNISATSLSPPRFAPPGFLPTHGLRSQRGPMLHHVLGDPSDCCLSRAGLPPAFSCPKSSCPSEPCPQPVLTRLKTEVSVQWTTHQARCPGCVWRTPEAKVTFGFCVGGGVKAGAPWGLPVQGTR